MSQLALPIRLQDHAVFASFHAVGNEELVAALRDLAAGVGSGAWIYGQHAVGKTHLLQSVCAAAGDDCVYLNGETLSVAGPAMLAGLETRQLVAIDDIEQLLGDDAWEFALFGLYNAMLQRQGQLLVASTTTQRESTIKLPDLASRLRQLPTFRTHALSDPERRDALQLRAGHRGLDLPDETANYLLSRSRRDMQSLYLLLDHLDREALRAQRRLTIPFVRECLANFPDAAP